MAITFDSRSWRYTTPFTTTGVVATPSVSPADAAAPVDSIGTHHATPSLVTFALLIELATSRVLARFAPGSVHPAATAGLADVAGALLAAPDPACLLLQPAAFALAGPLLLQPPTARAATSATALPVAMRVFEHLI